MAFLRVYVVTIALSIEHLNKVYANGLAALKDVNFSVKQGDFFALLGPNGAGKSTLIGILCSLVRKTSGTVKIFDDDIDLNFSKVKQQMGVVPQEINLNHFETAFNILVAQAGYYGMPRRLAKQRAEYYLKKLDLWDKRDTISRRLSGGMRRRLMVARALMHQPKLLILDEPTAGVDIEMRRSLWALLREINAQGTTIILTTHYLEEAESLCRHIAIINHGKVVEHTSMRQLLGQSNREVVILDMVDPLSKVPDLQGCTGTLVDPYTLEVVVEQDAGISALFTQLNTAQITVKSMRNKASRLEELFVDLTKHQKSG